MLVPSMMLIDVVHYLPHWSLQSWNHPVNIILNSYCWFMYYQFLWHSSSQYTCIFSLRVIALVYIIHISNYMGFMVSPKSLVTWLFVQQLVQAKSKGNIKCCITEPLWRESPWPVASPHKGPIMQSVSMSWCNQKCITGPKRNIHQLVLVP